MADRSDLLWRMLPGVRRPERERFLFFFGLAALLGTASTIALAGSEALFLSGLGAQHLPVAIITASLATLTSSIVYASLVGRMRNDRLFVVLLSGVAISLLIDVYFLRAGSSAVLLIVFATFYIAQAVFVSLHFWTFCADFFDTLASKRLFPLFAVGSSLGGMLGGALAVAVSRTLSGEALILAWAITLTLAAIYVRIARARLLRWAPVGSVEADESSVEGLRGALRYLARSRMATWLVVSVVGMVFSLTLMQVLYLDIFGRSFDSAEQLATFFGVYLAVTNGIEILVGNALTPWLIRRFGVAQANLAHPVLTLVTFVGLAIDPRLWIAVLARVDRELLENALAGPVRALSYNALPHRFRGRMRALLEGVVFYAAMSIAGAVLLVLGDAASTLWLAGLGAAGAILYAGANWIVRREYLKSLVEELRHGRLDLGAIAEGLGDRELSGLAALWQQTLTEQSERISLALLELAAPLAARGFTELVAGQTRHGDPRVRSAALTALVDAGLSDPDWLEWLVAQAIDDPDAGTRHTAAILTARLARIDEGLRDRLRAHLADPDADVRAEVALRLGDEGDEPLRDMARSENPVDAVAALTRLPATATATSVARSLADSLEPEVRAAAIDCLVRVGADAEIPGERLVEDLRHVGPSVRRAAARALARRNDPLSTDALARALDDVSRPVRIEAQAALASMGEIGVLAAAPFCRGNRIWTVDSALGALAGAGGRVAQSLLAQFLEERVAEAWKTRLAIAICPRSDEVAERFLHAALENSYRRARVLAFRVLERIEDPTVVRSVVRALDQGSARGRADALEVLSNLADRDITARLALLLEDGAIEDKLDGVTPAVRPPRNLDDVLKDASASTDRWLRLAAARYGDRAPVGAGTEPGVEPTEEADIMERLLALQRVPLFAHLSLEQLEVINRLLAPVEFLDGEVIVREGEPGRELFILVEGEVTFYKAWHTPAEERRGVMRPVGYFGEIAILDNEPRSATAIASQDSRLLTLASGRFRELILQAPEISFEVFPVLTARIRDAESRITDLKSGS